MARISATSAFIWSSFQSSPVPACSQRVTVSRTARWRGESESSSLVEANAERREEHACRKPDEAPPDHGMVRV